MKILFALSQLHCGGIEKSALSLLSKLVGEGHVVTLRISTKAGEFLPYVPKSVKVEEIQWPNEVLIERKFGRKALAFYLLKTFQWIKVFRLISICFSLRGLSTDKRALAIAERWCAQVPIDDEVYDRAIDFSEFTEIVYVANNIKARQREIWLHTEQDQSFSKIRDYLPYLDKYDVLHCVSVALMENVKVLIPELAKRVVLYKHIIDGTQIRQMADAEIAEWPNPHNLTRILSVGRFQKQKGFDLVPEIIKKLNESGQRVSWMLLGDGTERDAVTRKAQELGVYDQMLFPGNKINPYPYFKACDIYVQPSRYEGYCLTIAEARMLYKPIIATDFNGAREQLVDGKTGIVVKIGVDTLVSMVIKLILDHGLRQEFSTRLIAEEM